MTVLICCLWMEYRKSTNNNQIQINFAFHPRGFVRLQAMLLLLLLVFLLSRKLFSSLPACLWWRRCRGGALQENSCAILLTTSFISYSADSSHSSTILQSEQGTDVDDGEEVEEAELPLNHFSAYIYSNTISFCSPFSFSASPVVT